MRRLRCSTAHSLLCALALLVQATVLPLAHSRHAGGAGEAHGVARVSASGAAAAPVLHDARPAAAPHDAASCPLCATVAHARIGVAAPTCSAPLGALPPWLLHGAAVALGDRLPLAAGGPRAPPFFSA
jgi:hypothetical protein